MTNKLLSGTVALLLLFTFVRLVNAEPDCPTNPGSNYYGDCVEIDGFDSNDDGWSGRNEDSTTATWLSSKSFGLIFVSQSDGGVITVNSPMAVRVIQKSVWLDVGAYAVTWRGATDENTWMLWESYTPKVGARLPNNQYLTLGQWNDDTRAREQFASYQTNVFTVTAAGMVMFDFTITGLRSGSTFFLDHVIIQRVNFVPVSQGTPSPATFTPAPTSPPQATAVATPAPVGCMDEDTSDLVPEENRWAYLNDDGSWSDNVQRNWQRTQSTVTKYFNVNLPGSLDGSLFMPYSAYGAPDTRPAMVFSRTEPLPVPFYVLGYGMADSIQAGQSVTVEVWVRDATTWSVAYQQLLNSQTWLQFSYTITTPSPTYQVAFAVRRSDTPSSGGAYLDRLYIYGHPDLRPLCNGLFWSGTVGAGWGVPTEPGEGISIVFPADKPCPPDVVVPNNFWGPILANITLWLDEFTAFFDTHHPMYLADTARTFTTTPTALMLTVFASIFDLRLFFNLIGLMFLAEVIRAGWSTWIFVKKSLPFMGT